MPRRREPGRHQRWSLNGSALDLWPGSYRPNPCCRRIGAKGIGAVEDIASHSLGKGRREADGHVVIVSVREPLRSVRRVLRLDIGLWVLDSHDLPARLSLPDRGRRSGRERAARERAPRGSSSHH
jgi:hypothetical protein